MTRIPVPALDEVPTASKELLEWIMQTQPTGKVLNIQAQLAVAPAALAGYVALRRATEEHGTLDPKTRTAVLAMSGAALGVPYVESLTARIASSAIDAGRASALRAGELDRLNKELTDLLLRYRERITDPSLRPPGAVPVELLTFSFPLSLPDAGEPADGGDE